MPRLGFRPLNRPSYAASDDFGASMVGSAPSFGGSGAGSGGFSSFGVGYNPEVDFAENIANLDRGVTTANALASVAGLFSPVLGLGARALSYSMEEPAYNAFLAEAYGRTGLPGQHFDISRNLNPFNSNLAARALAEYTEFADVDAAVAAAATTPGWGKDTEEPVDFGLFDTGGSPSEAAAAAQAEAAMGAMMDATGAVESFGEGFDPGEFGGGGGEEGYDGGYDGLAEGGAVMPGLGFRPFTHGGDVMPGLGFRPLGYAEGDLVDKIWNDFEVITKSEFTKEEMVKYLYDNIGDLEMSAAENPARLEFLEGVKRWSDFEGYMKRIMEPPLPAPLLGPTESPGNTILGSMIPTPPESPGNLGRGPMAGPPVTLPPGEEIDLRQPMGYAHGGYASRGTVAGDLPRYGHMSVREEGETMGELSKRHRDQDWYRRMGRMSGGLGSLGPRRRQA